MRRARAVGVLIAVVVGGGVGLAGPRVAAATDVCTDYSTCEPTGLPSDVAFLAGTAVNLPCANPVTGVPPTNTPELQVCYDNPETPFGLQRTVIATGGAGVEYIAGSSGRCAYTYTWLTLGTYRLGLHGERC